MTTLQVRYDKLCTGCGTCAGVCPEKAITMTVSQKGIYTTVIDSVKCTGCALCLFVCPVGYSEPAGRYYKSYTGFSTDKSIRVNSSSGGLVTQLLIDALESGVIDGALVTRMAKNNCLLPEPFIARTRKDIISASQSKYCPVPANMALQTIMRESGRFAVVGLPCHIQGVRKAEVRIESLKNKIVLHIGLFCGHCPNIWSIKTFLFRQGIKDVTKISFRGNGWPGKVAITTMAGEKQYPLSEYYNHYGSAYFIPGHCLDCQDMMANASDISIGDAWLPEFKEDKIGRSIMIVRSETACKELVYNSIIKGSVELTETDIQTVNSSQMEAIYNKSAVAAHDKLPERVIYYLMRFYSAFSANPVLRPLLRYLPMRVLMFLRIPCDYLLSRRIKGK